MKKEVQEMLLLYLIESSSEYKTKKTKLKIPVKEFVSTQWPLASAPCSCDYSNLLRQDFSLEVQFQNCFNCATSAGVSRLCLDRDSLLLHHREPSGNYPFRRTAREVWKEVVPGLSLQEISRKGPWCIFYYFLFFCSTEATGYNSGFPSTGM